MSKTIGEFNLNAETDQDGSWEEYYQNLIYNFKNSTRKWAKSKVKPLKNKILEKVNNLQNKQENWSF